MNDIKNLSDREIQKVIDVCNDELDKRKRGRRIDAANEALAALEELVKIAPNCYVDVNTDPDWDWNEESIYLKTLVKQWRTQNFHFD